jgi:hypothetical protein
MNLPPNSLVSLLILIKPTIGAVMPVSTVRRMCDYGRMVFYVTDGGSKNDYRPTAEGKVEFSNF